MKITPLVLGVSVAQASILETFFGSNRNLADMCIDETTDLFIDAEMTESFEAVENEIEDKAECWSPGNSATYCIVDFDTFDSADEFEATCTSMGGKTVKVTAEVQCQYNGGTSPTQRQVTDGFVLTYQNLLDCVSDSCSTDEVTEKVSETLVNVAVEVGNQVNAQCSSAMSDFSLMGDDTGVAVEGGESSEGGESAGEASEGEESEGEGSSIEEDAKDIKSSGQCRSLMTVTAAIGAMVPLAI